MHHIALMRVFFLDLVVDYGSLPGVNHKSGSCFQIIPWFAPSTSVSGVGAVAVADYIRKYGVSFDSEGYRVFANVSTSHG